MDIVIVGAGIGGLAAASAFAKAGDRVTVFERANGVDAMRCGHDDVDPDAFARAGLPLPDGSVFKRDWTFVAPDGKMRGIREAHPDVTVGRTALDRMLAERAEHAGAKLVFGVTASNAIVRDGAVVGVRADGTEVLADLVVDSAGAFSSVGVSVAALGVEQCKDDEVFCVLRTFFERESGAVEAKYPEKVWLKYRGIDGIGWCRRDGALDDVLVGVVGKADEAALLKLQDEMRRDNVGVGDRAVIGGKMSFIPVGYPSTRAVANGYAAIGDRAFLTIPMLGSGIAASLDAARMLTGVIAAARALGKSVEETCSVANLWNYQTALFDAFADHCGTDVMKRGVLRFSPELLSLLLTSDLLDNDEMCALAKGKTLDLPLGKLLKKAKKVKASELCKLLPVLGMLAKSKRAVKIAKAIPREWDQRRADAWAKRLRNAII